MSHLLDHFDPDKALEVTQHVNADPALRKNMLDQGFIRWFMGRWYLTALGEARFRQRFAARVRAANYGLIQVEEAGPASEEDQDFIRYVMRDEEHD